MSGSAGSAGEGRPDASHASRTPLSNKDSLAAPASSARALSASAASPTLCAAACAGRGRETRAQCASVFCCDAPQASPKLPQRRSACSVCSACCVAVRARTSSCARACRPASRATASTACAARRVRGSDGRAHMSTS
jgi:hypothetical protein